MFDPANPRPAFDAVFDHLTIAGWLKAHVFTEGKGHHLVWTGHGARRARRLRQIAEHYGLDMDDRAPAAFDISSKGGNFPGASLAMKLEDADLRDWREAVAEIGADFAGMEDGLLVLVHVVLGWG